MSTNTFKMACFKTENKSFEPENMLKIQVCSTVEPKMEHHAYILVKLLTTLQLPSHQRHRPDPGSTFTQPLMFATPPSRSTNNLLCAIHMQLYRVRISNRSSSYRLLLLLLLS